MKTPVFTSTISNDPVLDDLIKSVNVTFARKGQINFVENKMDFIEEKVCNYFNIRKEMINLDTRKREIVQVRQICMYFSIVFKAGTSSKVGERFANRDHATCLHACKTVNNLMDTDKRFRAQVGEIEKELKR